MNDEMRRCYEELSSKLGLEPPDRYEQDWGICRSDPGRVAEFLDVTLQREWPVGVMMDLVDLVLDSLFEAMEAGETPQLDDGAVQRFLANSRRVTPSSLEYWLEYGSGDDANPDFLPWLQQRLDRLT